MGVFTRIKDIASADLHNLLDRLEDPVSMAKQYIRQVEDQIGKSREALANQFASVQQFNSLIANTERIIAKRARQAELAVDRNEDTIAELALQDKLYHRQLLSAYEQQQDAIRKQSQSLENEISRLMELHQELQSKLAFLLSRANAAQAIQASASAAPALETDRIVRSFSRMEEQVWRLEAGAYASRQTNALASDPLRAYGQQEAIREELEKLKTARRELQA